MKDGAYVGEVAGGLEDLAAEELIGLGAMQVRQARGEVRFTHARVTRVLEGSSLLSAVYLALGFDVPRPKALLGDASFRRLSAALREVAGQGGMRTFRLAAAGAGSRVFERLTEELAAATGLTNDGADGELLMRVRRPNAGGWEALLRLTPRPLSARRWRVCNLPGGANATVAAGMARLAGPGDAYLNLMCGSGTLIVEWAQTNDPGTTVGVDVSPAAIECARANLESAGVRGFRLLEDDVTREGFSVPDRDGPAGAPGTFDVVAADAPWGDAVGAHRENERLYSALLAAAHRHLRLGGRFVLLTHEVRLTERLLGAGPGWRRLESRRVEHGGHTPLLLVLERAG